MKQYMQFLDRIIIDDISYFSHMRYNSLFKEDLKTHEVFHVGLFPSEAMTAEYLHRKIFCSADSLYFVPFKGCGISSYNIEKKYFNHYMIESKHGVAAYSNAFQEGADIYLIPAYDGVDFAVFNCETETIQYYPQIWREIKEVAVGEISFDVAASLYHNGQIIASIWNTNKLLVIDMKDKKVDYMELNPTYRLRNITLCDKRYWFTMTEGDRVVSCDMKFEDVKEYSCRNLDVEKFPLLQIVHAGQGYIAIPVESEYFWKLDGEQFERMDLSIPADFIEDDKAEMGYLGFEINKNDELLLYPKKGKYMVRFCNHLQDVSFHMITYEKIDQVRRMITNNAIKEQKEREGILHETKDGFCTLPNFLNYIEDMPR